MGRRLNYCVLALLLSTLWATTASALQLSPGAFHLNDRREGNLLLGAESAQIEAGESYGTVLLLWGHLEVYGTVDEVLVLAGKVSFREGSKLNKNLVVMGGSYEASPGAGITNESITARAPGPIWRMVRSGATLWRDNFSWILALAASVFSCALLWVAGYILFLIFPGLRATLVGRLGTEWVKNLVVGMICACVAPAFGVLLVISIFGVFLLPLYFFLLFLAGLVSYLTAALWAGQRIYRGPARKGRLSGRALLVGVVALQVLWLVGGWWGLGPICLLWTLAWGALLRSLKSLWK